MIKKNQKLECDNYANEITIVFLKNQNTDLIRKMEENNEDKERL